MRKMYFIVGIFACLITLIGYGCETQTGSGSKIARIDFNYHVRPILSDKCFKCHGPDANKREAGLRLDVAESAYMELPEDSGKYAIVPGNLEASQLYLRIHTNDSSMMMPPPEENLALTEDEKDVLTRWIEQGAEYKPHWAFIPPETPSIPEPGHSTWPVNAIDDFVLARMDQQGLQPSEKADKERLLKRVYYDLIGLPPDIAAQDAFLTDASPDAYEKVVDELLANPHFGEKMALHWLDVARYADSHGYQDDGPRTMWPWRDWVIHAFNANYPYNQFVTWQLAGDLLPHPNKEMLLATGFNRNHKITQEGGVIDEEYRVEYVTDRTNTFGKAFLALTYECAHCHDHKYDPIPMKNYYGTFAFFNQVPEKGLYGDISANSLADPPYMTITPEDCDSLLTFIDDLDSTKVRVMIMKDSSILRPTYILQRGVYNAHGEQVDVSTPKAILPFDTLKYPKNRLGLAEWLFDEQNPLTARVFVNRIWQLYFGRGLVKTSGDFGMQGELPSHPELLDWLAVDFRTHGWDIKRLVRQIMLSATYQQSAQVSKQAIAVDPENIYLSHAPRIRYAAELVRDMVFASSGLLNDKIGGPSVKTYQPDGIWEAATSGRGPLATYVQDHGELLYRRGMYQFIKRTVPPPVMLMFDASNRDQCEVQRIKTNTPLQALAMLNDPHVIEASRVMAEQYILGGQSTASCIEDAFRKIVCRHIRPEELELLRSVYDEQVINYQEDPERARNFLNNGEYPHLENVPAPAAAAMMQTIQTIYNMEESITKT
ncbi:MAG: PSD1 domain-containing protein [Saprospiraceae bacterium]|nr:PSD1 domain-containing protein [Saprospiraceae bacterium]